MKRPAWAASNVLVLGFVSLWTDTASEMIAPLLPVFLTVELGAGAFWVGLVEGAAEAAASGLKYLAGGWADRLGRDRPFVVTGYVLATAARPLMALAAAPWQVLAVRLADRVGKGLRTSPRDALLARSVSPAVHARAFALHRALDHTGAVLGPLLAAAFLAWGSGDLRLLFALTVIPGALAVVAVLRVREVPRESVQGGEEAGSGLRPFLLPFMLFTLGNASDLFLLLKAAGERAPLYTLPLLWVGLHVVKALAALPGGWLADRFGAVRTVQAGWTLYALVYAGFAFAAGPAAVGLLFVLYGCTYGLTEGPEKAVVAARVPARRHGRGFGVFHLVQGLLLLVASALFGFLWDAAGPRAAFLASAGLALGAAAGLSRLRSSSSAPRRPPPTP